RTNQTEDEPRSRFGLCLLSYSSSFVRFVLFVVRGLSPFCVRLCGLSRRGEWAILDCRRWLQCQTLRGPCRAQTAGFARRVCLGGVAVRRRRAGTDQEAQVQGQRGPPRGGQGTR